MSAKGRTFKFTSYRQWGAMERVGAGARHGPIQRHHLAASGRTAEACGGGVHGVSVLDAQGQS